MAFIVIEIQKNEGTISTIITQHATLNEARAKYHQVLSVAAISGLERHGAVLLREDGYQDAYETYPGVVEE
jgi:hypothetical protein